MSTLAGFLFQMLPKKNSSDVKSGDLSGQVSSIVYSVTVPRNSSRINYLTNAELWIGALSL